VCYIKLARTGRDSRHFQPPTGSVLPVFRVARTITDQVFIVDMMTARLPLMKLRILWPDLMTSSDK